MGMFSSKKEPVITKETSNAKKQIEELEALLLTAPEDVKPQIEQDIKLLGYGIFGEDQILFELKNSHISMHVLQQRMSPAATSRWQSLQHFPVYT